jgi:hypothetical protein
MIWNNFKTCVFLMGFVFTCYTWYRYFKNTPKEQRKKEGWNRYYALLSLLFFILLIDKLVILFR